MTIKSRLFPVLALLAMTFPPQLRAQDKLPVKFGKVTPDDFKVTAAALDTAADVVVVADFATSSYDGNAKGWFDLVFRHSKRLRILKRTGFNAATIEIPLYVDGTEVEKITGLKASTYTLEDGKVVETKLDSKSIFTDKISDYLVEEKFTFPALKEGAILEYSYTLASPLWPNIQPWEFQGEYPCLWSEYQVEIPNFFKFNLIGQGNLSFKVNTNDTRPVSYHVTVPGGAGADDHEIVDDMMTTHRWVMANVQPLKEEPYTTTIDNYVAKLDFYLTGYQIPGDTYHDVTGNWANKCDEIMKSEHFGADLSSGNSWMDDNLKTITKGAANNLEKAQKIFSYIRDNFTCTGHGSFWLSNSLKTVYKTRNGNEADLNLLLTAMLIHAGLDAKPVILSTRGHGVVGTLNPVLIRFNYVIGRVTIDSTAYCLDASEPWLGFGRLPQRCYNGAGRVVDKENTYLISLSADSLTEGDVTLVIINNDEKGGLTARVQTKPGNQESEDMRQEVKEHGQQAYLKRLQTAFGGDAAVANLEMDSVLQPDEPLNVAYDLHMNTDSTADLYYFNPMLTGVLKENPFKAAVRTYPVEMPHAMDETYSMMMDIPAGYVVDELPKSAKVLYNTDEGFFEYLMIKGEDQIQFRTRIKLKKATYTPEDYVSLRDFFAYVVKKQGEQIVFKKKK